MNLVDKKKVKLLQIEKARILLNIELENGTITEKDLISLLSTESVFGLKTSNKQYTYKQSVLKSIFNSPFVLCDQDNLSISIKKVLPIFLKVRYDMEIDELTYLKENNFITEKEYIEEENLIKFCYYGSSLDGKNILKKGYASNILDNKIKVR